MTARARRHWSQDEVEYLRAYYGSKPMRSIARKLGRSHQAVRVHASKLGISAEHRDHVDAQTCDAWGAVLGVWSGTITSWIRRGVLRLGEYDVPFNRTTVISEETMEAWLRQGGALRCKPTAQTPHYWATIIAETKALYMSNRQLARLGINVDIITNRLKGLGLRRLSTAAQGRGHVVYYKKSEVYDTVYCIGHTVPRTVKDPYVKAVVMAWDSVYVARWELVKRYKPRRRDGHPEPIIRGVYNRAEVVAWLKTRSGLAHHAQALRQDPVCYRDLHRDLDRKVRQGLPI